MEFHLWMGSHKNIHQKEIPLSIPSWSAPQPSWRHQAATATTLPPSCHHRRRRCQAVALPPQPAAAWPAAAKLAYMEAIAIITENRLRSIINDNFQFSLVLTM
jgi:hypothetical protein